MNFIYTITGVSFIIANTYLIGLSVYYRLSLNEMLSLMGRTYIRIFRKLNLVLAYGLFHPIKAIMSIGTFLLIIIFSVLEVLLDPGCVLTIGVLLVSLFILYHVLLPLTISVLWKLLIGTLVILVVIISANFYYKLLQPIAIKVWYSVCYIKKASYNAWKSTIQDTAMMSQVVLTNPKDYVCNRINEYLSSLSKAKTDKDKMSPNKTRHKKTSLDILYPDELKLFGFYMKDFTYDDLTAKKRELLKIHHPDNYQDSIERHLHQKQFIQISEAYTQLITKLK